jgi:hypothetical protein
MSYVAPRGWDKEKIGGVLVASRTDGGGRDSVFYAITAGEHRRRRS